MTATHDGRAIGARGSTNGRSPSDDGLWELIVARTESPLATRATTAQHLAARMVGLLSRAALAPGEALILPSCRSIHTWFMRFPIDVLFIDADGRVVRAVDALGPFGMAWGGWHARTTIELPAGTLRSAGVMPGARVRIEPA